MIPEHLAGYIGPLEPIPTALEPVLPAGGKIEAILFDIYGTLFISGSGDISHAQSGARKKAELGTLLRKFDIDIPPDVIQGRFFAAIKDSHEKSRKKGIDFPEVEIDRIWQTVIGIEDRERAGDFSIEYELLVNPVGPMPHLTEVLDACRSAPVATGIISNAQFFTPLLFNWFLDSDLNELGFNPELLFFSWEWGIAKPSIKLFEEAADRLSGMGIARQEVFYVGNDVLNDILPAQATGFRTALFAGDKRSLRMRSGDPRCAGLKPDMIITDLIQLAELLNHS
jgi:putative hydrolase of the HAD superfamily